MRDEITSPKRCVAAELPVQPQCTTRMDSSDEHTSIHFDSLLLEREAKPCKLRRLEAERFPANEGHVRTAVYLPLEPDWGAQLAVQEGAEGLH